MARNTTSKSGETAGDVIEGEVVVSTPPASNTNVVTIDSTYTPTVLPNEKEALYTTLLEKAQVDFLLQRTPPSEVRQVQGRGGKMFDYISQGYVTERLNLIFGFNWDFEIVDKEIIEGQIVVEGKLTARTPGGQAIVKSQFGGSDIKRFSSGAKEGQAMSIADDYKTAGSDALKKCATLLGIGIDLYGRDSDPMADDTDNTNEVRRSISDAAKAVGMDSSVLTAQILTPILNAYKVEAIAKLPNNATRLAVQEEVVRRIYHHPSVVRSTPVVA